VCSLTAVFGWRNLAHGNDDKHKSRAERSQSGPFPIQIVPDSTTPYHPYLQLVRRTSQDFSRTAVLASHSGSLFIRLYPLQAYSCGDDFVPEDKRLAVHIVLAELPRQR
jgi:hypothetical protein